MKARTATTSVLVVLMSTIAISKPVSASGNGTESDPLLHAVTAFSVVFVTLIIVGSVVNVSLGRIGPDDGILDILLLDTFSGVDAVALSLAGGLLVLNHPFAIGGSLLLIAYAFGLHEWLNHET